MKGEKWDRVWKRERGVHERTISAGVVWCMYCTCNTVQGLGRASPSPAQSFVGLSANITFPRAFNNIVSLFDVADSVFSAIYWKIRNTRGKCLLTKSFSNVHYIAAILLLTMLAFLFICTELVSVNAIASRTVLRVISIEFWFTHHTNVTLQTFILCVFTSKAPLCTCLYFVFAPLIVNGAILVFEQLFYSLNVLNTQILVIFNKLVRAVKRSFS